MPTQQDSTRRQITSLLKREIEMTAAKMAEVIGITSMGVRQHLNGLERDGLVETVVVRQKRGRPTYLYRLTDDAESMFPARYEQIALDLLEQLGALDGPDRIDRFFAGRMEALEQQYRTRMEGKAFGEQIAELARIRDDEGYMAESDQTDEEYTLVEHHCPIYAIAKRHPQACRYEQELFARALAVDVQRTEHKVTGDGCCRYVIKQSAEA